MQNFWLLIVKASKTNSRKNLLTWLVLLLEMFVILLSKKRLQNISYLDFNKPPNAYTLIIPITIFRQSGLILTDNLEWLARPSMVEHQKVSILW